MVARVVSAQDDHRTSDSLFDVISVVVRVQMEDDICVRGERQHSDVRVIRFDVKRVGDQLDELELLLECGSPYTSGFVKYEHEVARQMTSCVQTRKRPAEFVQQEQIEKPSGRMAIRQIKNIKKRNCKIVVLSMTSVKIFL
jgi:hypothetical protein